MHRTASADSLPPMTSVTIETRRRPAFWVRVLATGVINLFGLWIAGALDLVAYDDKVLTLLLAALVLAAINIVVRPIMTVLSIPFIIVTLGFFLLVVNAMMLWFTDQLVPDFDLFGFWRTVWAVVILWFANLLLGGLLRDFTEKPRRETFEV